MKAEKQVCPNCGRAVSGVFLKANDVCGDCHEFQKTQAPKVAGFVCDGVWDVPGIGKQLQFTRREGPAGDPSLGATFYVPVGTAQEVIERRAVEVLTGFLKVMASSPVEVTKPEDSLVQDFQNEIAEWQTATFPDQTIDGKLAHLVREANELKDNPEDITEWADVFNLLLGAAVMARLKVADLVNAGRAKLEVCRQREWGPADEEGVHHHVKAGEAV